MKKEVEWDDTAKFPSLTQKCVRIQQMSVATSTTTKTTNTRRLEEQDTGKEEEYTETEDKFDDRHGTEVANGRK